MVLNDLFQLKNTSLIVIEAKKRLKEASKEGDSKIAKKARKLAEDSQPTQKNSILRHVVQVGAAALAPTKKLSQRIIY
jgi:hypothetical protein